MIIMELTEETGQIRAKAFGAKADYIIIPALYAVTLVIHILMTLCTTIFNLTPDEYSVTAVAALANGYNWHDTVCTGGYYGYFQSIFYIPVFGMTDDPYMRYRIMLIINGVLVSFVPVIAYWISSREFGIKRLFSVLFALICGWYPAYMLLTKYTWNESMCILLMWVFALLIFRGLSSSGKVSKQIFSVLGGLTLAAAYATHGRMLALLAAGIVLQLVVFFSMRKTRIFCFTGFFGAAALGFAGDYFIKHSIQSVLWRIDDGVTPTNTIEKMLSRLFQVGEGGAGLAEGVSGENFLNTLVGHLFYFISSTWGFGAICIAAVVSAIVLYYRKRPKKSEPAIAEQSAESGMPIDKKTAIFMWFALLAMGAIFVVSVCFKATSTLLTERGDTMIYGRYTEIFYPIAILAGLTVIYKNIFGTVQSFVAMCIASAINVMTVLWVMPVVTSADRFVSAMIMNIAPLRYGEGMRALLTQESFIKIIITTMSMLFLWLLVGIIRRNDKNIQVFFSVPLAALLLYSGIYGYVCYTVPQSKNAANGANKIAAAIELVYGDFDSVTCCNLTRERYVKGQFLYPDLDVKVVSSASALRRLDTLPDIIIATDSDVLATQVKGIYLVGSAAADMQVYAGNAETAEKLRAKGLRVAAQGEITYVPADIPATANVQRTGLSDGNANYPGGNVNYDIPENSEATVVIPGGAAVYTDYVNLPLAGSYLFIVNGSGVDRGRISLTSSKGADNMEYEIIEQTENTLCVKAAISGKTENVRFKLSGTNGEPIEVDSLTIKRSYETAE